MENTKISYNDFDIALSDFIVGYQERKINCLNDIYMFAKYMQGFYPNIPYFDVANMIIKNIHDNEYESIFKREYFGLNKIHGGHFMEIINFTDFSNDTKLKVLINTKE